MSAGIDQREPGTPVPEPLPLRRDRFVETQVAIEALTGVPPIDLKGLRRDLDAIADPGFLPRD